MRARWCCWTRCCPSCRAATPACSSSRRWVRGRRGRGRGRGWGAASSCTACATYRRWVCTRTPLLTTHGSAPTTTATASSLQMTRMIDILEDYCQYRGYGYCRIDGNTSGEDRESQVGAERLMPDAGCWLMWALGGGARGGGRWRLLCRVPGWRTFQLLLCRPCCHTHPQHRLRTTTARAATSSSSCCPPAPAGWASTCTPPTWWCCTTRVCHAVHAALCCTVQLAKLGKR